MSENRKLKGWEPSPGQTCQASQKTPGQRCQVCENQIDVEARDDMRGLLKLKIDIRLLAEAGVDMLGFWNSKMEGLVAEAGGGMVGF